MMDRFYLKSSVTVDNLRYFCKLMNVRRSVFIASSKRTIVSVFLNYKMEASNFLILGGCGFIGRNLVTYLIDNNLVQYLRVVDKVPPQIAWLGEEHLKCFNLPNVEFKSANLINPASCKNAFVPPEGINWNFVINCAGETKPSQTDSIYKEGILKLSLNCANESASYRVHRYVELSSGQLVASNKTPVREDDECHPWTYIAKWKQEVEKEIYKIPNLNYTILRPALVYGPGDKQGLMTRLIIGSLYSQLSETVKLLWSPALKMNTVHVQDVCRVIYHVCTREDACGQVFNVVDDADSTQGSLSQLIGDVYGLKIKYYGNIISSIVDLSTAADEGNDKHLSVWAEACAADGIHNTPLSPHLDTEMLLNRDLCLDGTKLKEFGFEMSVPCPNHHIIKEIIQYFRNLNVFPKRLVPDK